MLSVLRIFAALILLLGAAQSWAAERVALVIGNSDYQFFDNLPHPENSAAAMSDMLASIGFIVTKRLDQDQAGLAASIKEFVVKVETAEVALFYFSGHGGQVGGRLYLVPTDARLDSGERGAALTYAYTSIIGHMGGKGKTGIALLDVSRDKAQIQKLVPPAPAIGSATISPGKELPGGYGAISPYAAALVKHLPTPGTDILLLMRTVLREVIAATDGKQTPAMLLTLDDGFHLVEK